MEPDLPGKLLELFELPVLQNIQSYYNIGMDDKGVFELLSDGGTDDLFYFGQARVRRALRMIHPDSVEELADVFAMTFKGRPSEKKF